MEDAIERIGDIEDTAKSVFASIRKGKLFETDSAESNQLQQLVKLSEEQVDRLSTLKKRSSRLTLHGHLYLWGWFFLMPFGIAGYAMVLSIS
ncbi:MAG: hypothetical protein ACXIU7_02870 [Roseinatronobacter sp.]